ncbi:hypothetical protein ACFLZ5_11180 [Thermodesulfobacteriota bacterium]
MFKMICTLGTICCLCLTFAAKGSFANTQETVPPAEQQKEISIEEKWGVKVEALRISAAGNLVDFRYRIVDPEKASYLVDRRNKPYMIDNKSGKVLSVPTTAKVGPLRQTVRYGLPKKDRIYFILFGNPHILKPGDKVSVVIGDFKVEDLVIE